MSRHRILSELEEFFPINDAELQAKKQIMKFIQSEPECFNRSHLQGHVTGSALLISADSKQVLLNHHKAFDKWLTFGGHADGESNIFNVAWRETLEESGIQALQPVGQGIFDVDVHAIPERKDKGEPAHTHYDISYIFRAEPNAAFQVSDESYGLQWLDFDETLKLSLDVRTLRMLYKWQDMAPLTFYPDHPLPRS